MDGGVACTPMRLEADMTVEDLKAVAAAASNCSLTALWLARARCLGPGGRGPFMPGSALVVLLKCPAIETASAKALANPVRPRSRSNRLKKPCHPGASSGSNW